VESRYSRTAGRFNTCHSFGSELHHLFKVYPEKFALPRNRADIGISRGYRIFIPFLPFLVFIYLFYQLGSFLPSSNPTHFWRISTRSLTEECVLRVGAMGVTIMAILTGFGSICASWETYLTPQMLTLTTSLY